MDCRKIKNLGYTLVEILLAFSMVGLLAIFSLQLLNDKKSHSDSTIIRSRELTDLILNLRFLKKDIEYAQAIERSGDTLIVKLNRQDSATLIERTIEYEIVTNCNLGKGQNEKPHPKTAANKNQFASSNGNFSCLQRTVIEGGIPQKSFRLTGIKNLKWCLTSENCNSYLSTLSEHMINTPPTTSTSMIKLQIYDYKGVLIKMILGLSNIGYLEIPRKDIILIN